MTALPSALGEHGFSERDAGCRVVTLYFLFLRLYSPQQLAEFRGQTDRNIRKVRDTMLRKIRKKVYQELTRLKKQEYSLTLREQAFFNDYEEAGEGK